MSTRAVYSFKDDYGIYHVYKHSDGYPTGAVKWLQAAKTFAWTLPRYEANEFAAAFVCANKLPYWCEETIIKGIEKTFTGKIPSGASRYDHPVTVNVELINPYPDSDISRGGQVRLLHSGAEQTVYDVAPLDIEFRYEVYQDENSNLWVKAYSTNFWEDRKDETLIFDCKLDQMEKFAKKWEKARENA